MELVLIVYIVVSVIHIGLFRFFKGYYRYIDKFGIPPTAWCFLWPLGYIGLFVFYLYALLELMYYGLHYLVTGQWTYR